MDSPINFLDLPKGVDVNFQDNLGNTILHSTVKNNDLTTTRYLRHYDVNFNIQNFEGNTPLHIACKNHNLELVEFIYRYGGDRYILNKERKTPFDYLSGIELSYMNNICDKLKVFSKKSD